MPSAAYNRNIIGNGQVKVCKKFKAFHNFELQMFVLVRVTVNAPLAQIIRTDTCVNENAVWLKFSH